MDEHIKKLFEQVPEFYESDLFSTPECARRVDIVFDMESMGIRKFGPGSGLFFFEYLIAQLHVLDLVCLYYFHQGYLAAQSEYEKDKNE